MSIARTQQALFTPVRMGKLELRNRIVMAPLPYACGLRACADQASRRILRPAWLGGSHHR